MRNKRVWILGGVGCGVLFLLIIAATTALVTIPFRLVRVDTSPSGPEVPNVQESAERVGDQQRPGEQRVDQEAIPTLAAPSRSAQTSTGSASGANEQAPVVGDLAASSSLLTQRYSTLNPGVVNIRVISRLGSGQQGAGAGSGFVLDQDGHIVTNNHVIDQAAEVIVIFYNGLQAEAAIIGADDDSDLAIIKVEELPEDVTPLPIGDSDLVQVGDWAIAIGNPFGLGSSMTLGIVSAIGRSIPSGATPFNIPQAIQTDAAINPGNSGGPLLNLQGQVIGVNAQIRTGGGGGNTGVGFAIPANVVRNVAPVLIVNGFYEWPWLGVEGSPINLTLMEANNLETQRGAYIASVVPGGPADSAGLRGGRLVERNGISIPVGGDVVTAIDGNPVLDFDDLSSQIAFKSPDEQTTLTVLRDGRQREIVVTLEARPTEFGR